jgi:hypothetical protein
MRAETPDWEEITPTQLVDAVRYIRESFDEKARLLAYRTRHFCFAALHDAGLGHTAPTIFKRFLDIYQEGISATTEKQFRELLQIGLANAEVLNKGPVEWAKSHLHILIMDEEYRVRHWIKEVCDTQDLSKIETPDDLSWPDWRAPRLIHMQPSGNTPYDVATIWSREDQEQTEKLLDALSRRFAMSPLITLDRIAGEAHVQLAKDGAHPRQPASAAKPDATLCSMRGEDGGVDPMERAPLVFVSYSWDAEDHKKWVLELASRLQKEGGVEVILDRWHLRAGQDRTIFMERSIRRSDFVILVSTPEYAERATQRTGGVGYEATIITGELVENINQGKFIPVLRNGEWESSLPVWIKTKLGIDLRGNPYSEHAFQDLLRVLHQEPRKPPPLGPKPILEQPP